MTSATGIFEFFAVQYTYMDELGKQQKEIKLLEFIKNLIFKKREKKSQKKETDELSILEQKLK